MLYEVITLDRIADRRHGIVRQRKRFDAQITPAQGRPAVELPYFGKAPRAGEGRSGIGMDVDRQAAGPGQRPEAAAVIAVLVGDQNRIEVFPGHADDPQAALEFAGREAGIDEDAGLV